MEIRFTAYEKKLAALEAKDVEIENLKMEVAALRERPGQNELIAATINRLPTPSPPPP